MNEILLLTNHLQREHAMANPLDFYSMTKNAL